MAIFGDIGDPGGVVSWLVVGGIQDRQDGTLPQLSVPGRIDTVALLLLAAAVGAGVLMLVNGRRGTPRRAPRPSGADDEKREHQSSGGAAERS